MSNCINYNCSDLDTHTPNDCGEELQGGIPAMLVLECDHGITDPSNATQVNAAIANGTATMISPIKSGIDPATPIEQTPLVSCETEELINYNRTGTIIDGNVSESNIDFYNQLFSGRKNGGLILYLCGTADSNQGAKVLWVDKTVKFKGSVIYPDNNDAQIRAEGSFAWRSINNPAMHDAPAGVF